MPPLVKHVFREPDIDLPEVQAFSCGTEAWEVEVAEWIKSRTGENSALEDMRQFGTEVWLYRTPEGSLVGFASLGATTYTWPPRSKKKERVSVIPCIGIQDHFKGEPKDAPREERYAYQILDDLIAEAASRTDRYPLLVLSVDEENKRASRFYESRGFRNLNLPREDKDKGITYQRMALDIFDVANPEPSGPASDSPPS